MNPEHHLADIRAFLSKSVDRGSWSALLKRLEEWSWEGDWSLVSQYLCQHLERWPDELRAFPLYSEFWSSNLQKMPDHPLFRIFVFAHMLSPKHLQEASLQTLLQLPAVRSVRVELKEDEPITYAPSFVRVLNRVQHIQIRYSTFSLQEHLRLFDACDLGGWVGLEMAYPMRTFDPSAVGQLLQKLCLVQMPKLRSFRMAGYPITDETLHVWLSSVNWPSLEELQIRHAGLANQEAKTLARSPVLGSLRSIDLSYNRLADDGLLQLAQASASKLMRLSLATNGLTDRGLTKALSSALLSSVRDLDLRFNDLSDDSIQRIAEHLPKARWEQLQLHFNPIRASALRALQDTAQQLQRDLDLAYPTTTASFTFYQDALRSEPFFTHQEPADAFFTHQEPTYDLPSSLTPDLSELPYLRPMLLGVRSEHRNPWVIESASSTHVGHLRQHNEDAVATFPNAQVFIVADGMGGGSSGYIPSGFLMSFLARGLGEADIPLPWRELERALPSAETKRSFHLPTPKAASLLLLLHEANLALYRFSSGAEGIPYLRGGAATFAALAIEDEQAWVAHAGDCRAYLFRDGQLFQLTEDHTLLRECIRMGLLRSPQETEEFPHKNVVLRAIGCTESLDIQLACFPIQPNDLFFLCSDGVHSELSSQALSDFFNAHQGSPQQITPAFLARILQEPCRDNFAFQCVRVHNAPL